MFYVIRMNWDWIGIFENYLYNFYKKICLNRNIVCLIFIMYYFIKFMLYGWIININDFKNNLIIL